MTRDICHFYPLDIRSVFLAHRDAIKQVFDKDCDAYPFVKLSFGLNFSFKYNMNGGACTLHFMPYANGTVVNIRYSIAQLFGARYEAHELALKDCVQRLLNLWATDMVIPPEDFERYAEYIMANPQLFAPPPPQQFYQASPQQQQYNQAPPTSDDGGEDRKS